eukprot:g3294.t1
MQCGSAGRVLGALTALTAARILHAAPEPKTELKGDKRQLGTQFIEYSRDPEQHRAYAAPGFLKAPPVPQLEKFPLELDATAYTDFDEERARAVADDFRKNAVKIKSLRFVAEVIKSQNLAHEMIENGNFVVPWRLDRDRRKTSEAERNVPAEEVAIVVAGNSGLPGGGTCNIVEGAGEEPFALDIERTHNGYATQEESVLSNVYVHTTTPHSASKVMPSYIVPDGPNGEAAKYMNVAAEKAVAFYESTLQGRWGLKSANADDFTTVQGVNFVETKNPIDFSDCWVLRFPRVGQEPEIPQTRDEQLWTYRDQNRRTGRVQDAGPRFQAAQDRAYPDAKTGGHRIGALLFQAAVTGALNAAILEQLLHRNPLKTLVFNKLGGGIYWPHSYVESQDGATLREVKAGEGAVPAVYAKIFEAALEEEVVIKNMDGAGDVRATRSSWYWMLRSQSLNMLRGAWWDPEKQKWYVRGYGDRSRLEKWFVKCRKCGEPVSFDDVYATARSAEHKPGNCGPERREREERLEAERVERAARQRQQDEELRRKQREERARQEAERAKRAVLERAEQAKRRELEKKQRELQYVRDERRNFYKELLGLAKKADDTAAKNKAKAKSQKKPVPLAHIAEGSLTLLVKNRQAGTSPLPEDYNPFAPKDSTDNDEEQEDEDVDPEQEAVEKNGEEEEVEQGENAGDVEEDEENDEEEEASSAESDEEEESVVELNDAAIAELIDPAALNWMLKIGTPDFKKAEPGFCFNMEYCPKKILEFALTFFCGSLKPVLEKLLTSAPIVFDRPAKNRELLVRFFGYVLSQALNDVITPDLYALIKDTLQDRCETTCTDVHAIFKKVFNDLHEKNGKKWMTNFSRMDRVKLAVAEYIKERPTYDADGKSGETAETTEMRAVLKKVARTFREKGQIEREHEPDIWPGDDDYDVELSDGQFVLRHWVGYEKQCKHSNQNLIKVVFADWLGLDAKQVEKVRKTAVKEEREAAKRRRAQVKKLKDEVKAEAAKAGAVEKQTSKSETKPEDAGGNDKKQEGRDEGRATLKKAAGSVAENGDEDKGAPSEVIGLEDSGSAGSEGEHIKNDAEVDTDGDVVMQPADED